METTPELGVVRQFVDERTDIHDNVRVSESVAHGSRQTRVTVHHRIPSPSSGRRARWLITTTSQLLAPGLFAPRIAEAIRRASDVRGRALYCVDLVWREVLAALTYHLDDDRARPVLITALALRTDGDDTLYRESLAATLVLKAYLHALGSKLGRGAEIVFEVPPGPQVAVYERALGFRKARTPKGYRSTDVYLSQRPFSTAPPPEPGRRKGRAAR